MTSREVIRSDSKQETPFASRYQATSKCLRRLAILRPEVTRITSLNISPVTVSFVLNRLLRCEGLSIVVHGNDRRIMVSNYGLPRG